MNIEGIQCNFAAEMKETLMQLEEQTLKQSHLEKRLKKVESELAAAQVQ